MEWSYRLEDGSLGPRKRSKAPTIGQARRRARRTLESIKASRGVWKPDSPLTAYIETVSTPAIAKAGLARLTTSRYELSMRLAIGTCEDHTHQHGLNRHTISSGTRVKALEALLTEVSSLHGRESARQVRTVVTKYVLNQLIRDELIATNPIAGLSLDELTGTKQGKRTRVGKTLTAKQYEEVVEYLLTLDPARDVTPRRGRWNLEQLAAPGRRAIDQALLQAGTGLRSAEANEITWARHVRTDADGMYIQVIEDIAKGGIARVSRVLDRRIAEHLLQMRQQALSEDHYVIGSPLDAGKVWDHGNRNKQARRLYIQIAREVDVQILDNERSHMWRTTLHALYSGLVPEPVLDAQFGNSEKTRAKHYTDLEQVSSIVKASRQLGMS